MKLTASVTFYFFSAMQLYAQVALLDKCYDWILEKDFVNAEQAIQLAEKNIVTANDARTHYLKAFLYKELLIQTTDLDRKNVYRNQSIQGVKRCNQLDHDHSLKQPLKQLRDFLEAILYNEGTEFYNNKDYNSAIQRYKQYIELKETKDENWLDANYFLGVCYYSLHSNDSAEQCFELVRERNYKEPGLFVDLSYLLLEKNSERSLDVIREGLSKYPGYYDLRISELNALSKLLKYDSLERKIEKFLTQYPDNVNALLMAATTYEKLRSENMDAKYFDKAEKIYLSVIGSDSMHYQANYNLGVLYYNEAVDIVNKSDLETNILELNRILERSTVLFEKSLPLLIRIFDQNKDPKKLDIKLLQALQAIYYNLNMKKELNNINTLIKSLSQ